MSEKFLKPYINVFQNQQCLSPTFNRNIYVKKIQDREKYTAPFTREFLQSDPNLSRTDMMLAMGSTIFMLFAAFKGCCDIDWERMFKLSPKDYVEYINAGYEKVAEKFPKVLKEYNKLEQESRQQDM